MIKVVCRNLEKIRDKICCKGYCVVTAAVDIEATVEVVTVSTTSMKTIHKVVQSCNCVNGGASCMVNFISSHHLLLA
ncbi:hypothetical protein QYF36_002566 [Acer negundo]|nr:hypothetical protein QYF36_002566 [Acer negundo]